MIMSSCCSGIDEFLNGGGASVAAALLLLLLLMMRTTAAPTVDENTACGEMLMMSVVADSCLEGGVTSVHVTHEA